MAPGSDRRLSPGKMESGTAIYAIARLTAFLRGGQKNAAEEFGVLSRLGCLDVAGLDTAAFAGLTAGSDAFAGQAEDRSSVIKQ